MPGAGTTHTMKITHEFLKSLVGPSGNPPKAVVEALGLKYPLRKKWMASLIGREIAPRAAERLIELAATKSPRAPFLRMDRL